MRPARRLLTSVLCALAVTACSSGASGATTDVTTTETVLPTTTVQASATTVPATTMPPTTAPATTVPTTAAPTTTAVPETTVPDTTVAPVQPAGTTPYGMPVADGAHAGYSHEHHDYPASDVFVPGSCGSTIIAPVNGVVLEARRVDAWTAAVDNPATRGGQSVAILGDDGVRYYLAHFDAIDPAIEPGVRVGIGQLLGLMGRTGRAGACHVHFAISPPCPGKEWSVRRGVIYPWRYLVAWRRGEQLSPVAEVQQWLTDHPDACAMAMADPNAPDS
jgi:murein DD-endopeptidase MepM/ murein hydrolase activator NlpD